MNEPPIRPLTPDDAAAARAVIGETFAAGDRAAGREPEPLSDERRARFEQRIARFPVTDAPGCWVAEDDGDVIGMTAAIRRGPLWGLSLLFVHPDHQSRRLGSRLLAHTRAYAEGASVEVIMASDDHRAIRRYLSLGLDLHPGMGAKGKVDRSGLPDDLPVRAGRQEDLDLVGEVDRTLRAGSTRVDDVAFLLSAGSTLHVVDRPGHRGYVVENSGGPECLGASDPETAQHLLWAALTHATDDVAVWGLTAAQGWAFDVMLAAGLQLGPGGPMFWRGMPSPGPYLPSGIYF